MKRLFITITKYLFRGIAWGCTFFVFFCLGAYFWQGKDFLLNILEYYPKHAIGSILVGIGYGSTPVVYQWKRPSLAAKALIHFFVGTSVFFWVASYLAWIPLSAKRYIILELLVSCVTFTAVWMGFYLFGCKEAKKINDRLQELEKDQELTVQKQAYHTGNIQK